MKNRIIALLYHGIIDDSEAGGRVAHIQDRQVTVSRFREQMQFLLEQGYEPLTVEEFFACREGRRETPEKAVLITFDDGFDNHFTNGYKVLAELGLKGSFFVVGDRIGQAGFLNKEQLIEMADTGMEIGSHGHTHTFLAYLSPEEVMWELTESKTVLEKAIGRRVANFAFPGGHYKHWMFRLMEKAGYRGACSCHYGWNDKKTHRYLIKRIDIRNRMGIEEFAACFKPSNVNFYRGVYFIKESLRRFVGRRGYTALRKKLYRFYRFSR